MNVLDRLRGGLIVSVQADENSPLNSPTVLAAMALAAEEAGAAGLRMQGVANITEARKRTSVPMIGILKSRHANFEPYITPTLADVDALLALGVEIVAFDATPRPRPDGSTVAQAIARIQAAKALAMADCASIEDGERAAAAGADIIATTLCGYTNETSDAQLPATGLVRAWAASKGAFIVCEGGIYGPDLAREALQAGADAIVVGTALTNIGWRVKGFLQQLA